MFELIYPVEPAAVLPRPTAKNPGRPLVPISERVPVVEENGLVIGQASRESVHDGSKLLHPVVHLHIINREGCLFLQKRSLKKDLFPGRWDTAVGGHVDYGELLESALYREAREELGFKDFNPVLLRTYVWESEVERELVNVFATVGDFSLHPRNDEVTEGRYWPMEEIEKHIGSSLFTPNFEQEFTSLKQILLALL
ncbi:MAG: NUDIX domain-containing protein [Bacteroidales bacterium]|jgi:isopentenyldiphosphate isomerase|nr:NUDIX domain-containing protein [Bacteroidota bacterium]NLN99460.1 NUDIX domain-containing protein [Bacteroidales bacterium]